MQGRACPLRARFWGLPQECIGAFVGSQVTHGFSQITIENAPGCWNDSWRCRTSRRGRSPKHYVDQAIAALVKRGVSQTTPARVYVGSAASLRSLRRATPLEIEACSAAVCGSGGSVQLRPARLRGATGAGAAADGRAGRGRL
jgi:hypothetical protein